MATQRQPSQKGSKNDMIECDYCGEVYSSTYRTCPFCDESRHPVTRRTADGGNSGGSAATNRGRRVAKTTRGGGYGKPAYLSQIIFWVTTLALILGACWVVSLTVGPLLNRDEPVDPDTSVTTPDVTKPDVPDVTVPDVTIPDAPDPVVDIDSLKLSHSDVTLPANQSFTIAPTITPSDADVTVIWSSSSDAATVSLSGVVTNTNTGSSKVAVTITATAGDETAECIVRCNPGSSAGATTPPTITPPTTSNSDKGVVAGAASGLNVRSGAGTTHDVVASLTNGTEVTILDKSTSGWYKVNFINASGTTATGYVSSDFITLK